MIRRATLGDEAQVAAVMSDWIDETPWFPRLHTRDDDMKFCRHLIESHKVSVLVPEDTIAGFIAIDAENDVDAFYLAPQARGQGYGKAMLDRAKAEANHLELWVFQANTRAIAFYRREGFAEVRRTDGADNQEKLPDVRMKWIAP